jgi:hypothetical protein
MKRHNLEFEKLIISEAVGGVPQSSKPKTVRAAFS